MDPVGTLNLTVAFAAVGVVVTCLEHLVMIREFGPGGICSPVLHIGSPLGRGRVGELVQSTGLMASVLVVRLFVGILFIVAGLTGRAQRWPLGLWFLALSSMWVAWRRRVGGDGGEQMLQMSLLASALGLSFSWSPAAVRMAALFIAGQACLSYLSAGLAKLVSGVWRSGHALQGIVNTHTHGTSGLSTFLTSHPRLARVLNWTVIVAELAFPAVLLLPKEACLVGLGLALLFHILNAVVMGLNNFVWAFLATYPCVYLARALVTS